jgi:hypothetical protein
VAEKQATDVGALIRGEGERLENGVVYIARPDLDLSITPYGRFAYSENEPTSEQFDMPGISDSHRERGLRSPYRRHRSETRELVTLPPVL